MIQPRVVDRVPTPNCSFKIVYHLCSTHRLEFEIKHFKRLKRPCCIDHNELIFPNMVFFIHWWFHYSNLNRRDFCWKVPPCLGLQTFVIKFFNVFFMNTDFEQKKIKFCRKISTSQLLCTMCACFLFSQQVLQNGRNM